VINVTEHTR